MIEHLFLLNNILIKYIKLKMKSLLESITMVNESQFEGIVDNIKALFCYDRLSNIQKDEVAEIFKPDSKIYGTIMKFSKNPDIPKPIKPEFNKSMRMCKDIYNALKP